MKRSSSLAGLILTLLLASGCVTVPKDWAATGGSKADGVIRLSYEYAEFEQPQVDEQKGLALAAQRCSIWGYTGAEAFGGVTRMCNQTGGMSGCMKWFVTKEYQCTSGAVPVSQEVSK